MVMYAGPVCKNQRFRPRGYSIAKLRGTALNRRPEYRAKVFYKNYQDSTKTHVRTWWHYLQWNALYISGIKHCITPIWVLTKNNENWTTLVLSGFGTVDSSPSCNSGKSTHIILYCSVKNLHTVLKKYRFKKKVYRLKKWVSERCY